MGIPGAGAASSMACDAPFVYVQTELAIHLHSVVCIAEHTARYEMYVCWELGVVE